MKVTEAHLMEEYLRRMRRILFPLIPSEGAYPQFYYSVKITRLRPPTRWNIGFHKPRMNISVETYDYDTYVYLYLYVCINLNCIFQIESLLN